MLVSNLDRTFMIGFEKEEKKIRLVILNKDHEVACRRESEKKLRDFSHEETANLFKGRLQLSKRGNEVNVILKNESIGTLTKEDFLNAIGG